MEGNSSSRPGVGVEGVGAFWFLSSSGFTSSWRTPAGVRGEPSFFSAIKFPAALAATSLSKAAEEVIDTSDRKELAEAWWSGAAPGVDEAWLRSLTFLESAASVELADCGLNGELKVSKRTTSSPRPPPPRVGTVDEVDEEEVVEEEATAFLSWRTAFAAALSFWMAESGDKLEPQGVAQLAGGHLSATPAHTKPLPLLEVTELKGSRGSCLMLVTEGAKEAGEAEPLLLFASFRARALNC